jgi:hemoglobin/transferrin/lactoferrin receptor protein
MRKIVFLLVLLYTGNTAWSQTDSTAEKTLEEAVVYSNKFVEKKKNLAQKIDVITSKAIARYNGQNTGDLLINTGNVFVQKSQQGGSSPVLRGFEASRVLLVVDGIRMNNAIYRAGHLQNIITVDQNMLERVEVMYGPASTLYGSDALGGIMHLRSKSPVLSSGGKLLITGSGFVRYSTANEEKTGHADVSLGSQKFAWLSSFTYSDFGDMKMGENYPKKYPNFGRRSRYIDNIGGIDYVITNDDDRIQLFSGYKQWDVTQKLLFQQSDNVSHRINVQYSNTNDVPRYDRLQDNKNFGGSIGTTLRYAKWYYGPQTRLLGSYELNVSHAEFFDELRFNVNYQDMKESRQTREYRRYDRLDSRREHVKVIGFNIDARKTWKHKNSNEINFGIDGQLNDVKSVADRTNINTGAISKLDTRYPNGTNKMNFFGAYAQHLVKLKGGKVIINDGLRLQMVSLHSTIVDNSFFKFPFTDIKQTPYAVTGNLGLAYMPGDNFRVTGNLSSGFRAPNVDDATKIFESSTATKRLVVPNPDLGPEYTYNFDLGISQTIEDKAQFEITAFYTLFRDAIATAPYKLNGQDSVLYNGTMCAVYASRNMSKAYVRGINGRLKINFSKKVSWDNTITKTYGRYNLSNGTKPLDHVPPVFGKTGFTYTNKKFNTEIYLLFNGWKKIKDYNLDGEDNQQYATSDGMPGWLTVNWRGSYTFTKFLSLQAGVENIADRNYRYFASGFSAPGRNFIVALRANW